MTAEELVPPGVDPTKPSIARVYDYMLGGKDNFAVDRQASEAALKITPDGPESGRANRAFLRRVVHHLVRDVGIRQFLDLGSGLPTVGNVHEVAQEIDQGVKVVYVDNDPMVLAHGRALLATATTATVIQADVRSPAEVFGHPETQRWLDFSQPVGLLMMAILHHINDAEDPVGLAAAYRDALPPGSYLALSHFCDPGRAHPDASAKALQVERIFNQTLGTGRWRRHDEIVRYFGDLELLAPGLVPVAEWRPEPGEEKFEQTDTYYTFVGGLARKP